MKTTGWRVYPSVRSGRLCLLGLACLLAGVRVAAQTLALRVSASDPLDTALDHLRNLEHDAARQEIETWLSQHPDDLRGLNYLGNVMLQREMFRRELLESQVYGAQGAAFRGDKVPLPAGLQQELLATLGKAETLAENRLKQNDYPLKQNIRFCPRLF